MSGSTSAGGVGSGGAGTIVADDDRLDGAGGVVASPTLRGPGERPCGDEFLGGHRRDAGRRLLGLVLTRELGGGTDRGPRAPPVGERQTGETGGDHEQATDDHGDLGVGRPASPTAAGVTVG